MNHRPTNTAALKNNVMLALASSVFPPYSILAQRYRKTDHTNKTWTDLRQDIDLIVTNNPLGTSRDPVFRHRDRNPREWRQPPSPFAPQPADNRASRTLLPRLPGPSSKQQLTAPVVRLHTYCTTGRPHCNPNSRLNLHRPKEPLSMLQLRRRPPRPGMRQPQVFHLSDSIHQPCRPPSSLPQHPQAGHQACQIWTRPTTRIPHPTDFPFPLPLCRRHEQPITLRQRI